MAVPLGAHRAESGVTRERPQGVCSRGWSVSDLSGTAIMVVRAQPGMAVPLEARAFFRG